MNILTNKDLAGWGRFVPAGRLTKSKIYSYLYEKVYTITLTEAKIKQLDGAC